MLHWSHVFYVLHAIIKLSTQSSSIFNFDAAPMRYVDYGDNDSFFDRVTALVLVLSNYLGNGRSYVIYTTGVFITEDRVLTSYNPFRETVKSKDLFSKTGICYLEYRKVVFPFVTYYTYKCDTCVCGRQIIPMEDKDLAADQWHGPEKKLSPVHDLMVLKLSKPVKLWERDESENYTYEVRHSEEIRKNGINVRTGPLLTKLANKEDIIDGSFKFVALGLKSSNSAYWFTYLEVANYDNYKDVSVNCNDWLPRNWGHFICIRNDFPHGFSSGALLIFNEKLFAVGSFTMFREKESILVFTDIRPYRDLINYTCTDYDMSIN